MWIHSIRLRNFKSYDNTVFTFPEPKDERNIVLIGAQNGHGKTTILEAVYLCLYDKDAVSHLQRAGLNGKEKNYVDFLQSALHHQAETKYGRSEMALELEIRQHYQGREYGLNIKRKWHFDSHGKYLPDDSSVIMKLAKNGDYEFIDEEMSGRYLNAYALPIDYAPFFFFDGEKIVQTAQQSGTGLWLNTALKGLLGVTLLEKLRVSLKDYRTKNISQNSSDKLQKDLEEAEGKLQKAQATLAIFNEELAEAQAQWQHWTEKRDSLMQQLGGGSDIRTSQDLMVQREKLEKEMDAFQNHIKAAVKSMPLAFLPRGRLKDLQLQLEREKNRLNHEAGKNQIAEKVDDFWNTFVGSEKVNRALGQMAGMIFSQPLLKEAVEDCWEQLFYPLPDNCADTIEHNYLSVNAHAEIQNEINKLGGMPQNEIGKLLEENEKRESERKRVIAEIENLQGTNNDELVGQLKEANQEADKYKERSGHLKSNLIQHQKTQERLSNEVFDLQNKISDSNPQLLKSRRAGEVDKVIVRLIEELLKQKVEAVGDAATRINRSIAHDKRIDRIRIKANGQMSLFGYDGYETHVDSSAGQMQILIMSLVSALAEVTHYQAPFIIDTPLARLDKGHREGLFTHWADLSQQVILLSQDTEITPEVYRRLEPHISRTYLVEAESLTSGGARSQVTADVYFK
ncbi:DNA sulfur modification protein DndD [Neisseria weixii]|uniref:DNA sulfur modification protein DndD n=1 Tax=Neisseria weixii TaxID=1853276 RepID=A0A3N4N614_9NEIS|nr:DNA sulfur modification protein DndD [Neisseria weixii]RPD89587.1 DNA sulfur modification protein DndD [Neisseria weixii]RPD89923.1 DNA sulfur modification protein DndD [Neisseria weixii]